MEQIRMADIIPLIGLPEPNDGQSAYNVPCPCCDENSKKKHLNINFLQIEDEYIHAVLCGMETILPEDVKATIRTAAEQHAKDILDKLRELKVDLRSNPACFIGGGSILFREFLEKSPLVAMAYFLESPNANALGYQVMAETQQAISR